MNRLSLDEVDRASSEIESAVDATAEIDRWCSAPDWVIPVHRGFAPESEAVVFRVETPAGPGFGLFARYRLADGRPILAGLEPLWGFASPIIGADTETTAALLAEVLADEVWDTLVLPGMPPPAGPEAFTTRIVRGLGHLGQVNVGEGITRQQADLGSGHAAWLARRGSHFRRNLRRAEAKAAEAGLQIVGATTTAATANVGVTADAGDTADVADQPTFERLLAIEYRSWKGQEDSGITSPEMEATYRAMVDRLQRQGRARIFIAQLDGVDVGYILGGVRAGVYRGLQLTYTTEADSFSVGHLLQHHQLKLLCESGEADRYDLGMDLEYKQRWADEPRPTFTLVVDRSR